ncbi:hypothetical protein IWW51_001094, partial [Coemansia sp. RSA 2702]
MALALSSSAVAAGASYGSSARPVVSAGDGADDESGNSRFDAVCGRSSDASDGLRGATGFGSAAGSSGGDSESTDLASGDGPGSVR